MLTEEKRQIESRDLESVFDGENCTLTITPHVGVYQLTVKGQRYAYLAGPKDTAESIREGLFSNPVSWIGLKWLHARNFVRGWVAWVKEMYFIYTYPLGSDMSLGLRYGLQIGFFLGVGVTILVSKVVPW